MPLYTQESEVDVLHIIGSLTAGGAERFVVDLLVELKRRGLCVGLVALSSNQDGTGKRFRQLLKAEKVFCECGPTGRVRLNSLMWYVRKLMSVKPKIVHLHTENTEFAHFLARKLYRPQHIILRTLHNTQLKKKWWHWMAIHQNPVGVSIACSESVKKSLAPMLRSKVISIRNGVNFDWPIQTPLLRRHYQKVLGLASDQYHFINVGAQAGESLATAQKGHDVLVKAWQLSGLCDQSCQLHFIGDGKLRPELERLAGSDESVCFHGIRDDVHCWLLASDCYVMPSRYEGLPIAGIEAVGTGLPCLFSDIAPLRELGAKSVLWSAVDDVKQLAENLREIKNGKVNVLQRDTANVRKRFGVEKTAQLYHECYVKSLTYKSC